MLKQIVLWTFGDSDMDAPSWQRLSGLADRLVRVHTREELLREMPGADALLIKLGCDVDAEVINVAPALRYIGMFGTDASRIDVVHAQQRSVTVCNISGYSTQAVAEYALGVSLDHLRGLTTARQQATADDFTSMKSFPGREVGGTTWGILGLGRIGSRVASLARAFGAQVRYWSRTEKPQYEDLGITFTDLDAMLPLADIVSVSLPLSSATHGILTAKRLGRLKANALLLALAPTELMDFDGLLSRVAAGDLTLVINRDELTDEQAQALQPYPTCIMYPPISYMTKESKHLRQESFIANLENFLSGQPINTCN